MEKSDAGYEFSFEGKIISSHKISYLSLPDGSVTNFENEGKEINFKTEELSRTMNIYYRTEEMLSPTVTYAEHPDHPDHVACQISFVPTF